MKVGVPGFEPERLRDGREGRGVTAISLAELVGVSRQAISQYESGLASPRADVLERIAIVLNLPVRFFLSPPLLDASPTVHYRSTTSATKAARTRVEGRMKWRSEILEYIFRFVEIPEVRFPRFQLPKDVLQLTDSDIEDIAQETRRYWNLGNGPISNVLWLLENNGAIIVHDDLGSEALDAVSGWATAQDRPFIVLGSEKQSASRGRLNSAHELCHILLHRGVRWSELSKPSDIKRLEAQANRFAGAFLFPEESYFKAFLIPTLDALIPLKANWKVSIGMMIHRAHDLDLVTEDTARRLWISYNRRGWKRHEPLDDELEIESPRLLERIVELILREGVTTRDELLASVPYHASDVEQLLALTKPTLSSDSDGIRVLELPRNRTRGGSVSGTSGELVKFPERKKWRAE
jgi:Zn-dependent peptidase ImmA (M78 family)/DNA-binding XRE family transcriptional regulator